MFVMNEWNLFIYDIVTAIKYNDNIDEITDLICRTVQYIVDRTNAKSAESVKPAEHDQIKQDAVKPIDGYGCYLCGVCKNPLTSVSQKFCSECGKAVKWDD